MYIALRNILILFTLLALFSCGWDMANNDPWGTDTVSVTATPESLQVAQTSIITAAVNNADGKAVQERTVAFTLRTNNSGGNLSVLNGETKGDGKAFAIYTAGNNSPENDVEDTIQVNLSNGAAAVVIVTRSGKNTMPTVATLTAVPATVNANQSSIITANVTDGAGKPLGGQTVLFSIPVTNSGSPALTTYSGISDGNGNVTTVYSPGTASPSDVVNDAVQASLANGSSSVVMVTRTAGTTGFIVTVTANPATLTVTTGVSLVTANVKDSTGTAVSGSSVTFNDNACAFGTVTAGPVSTDGAGNAVTSFKGSATGSCVVRATATIGASTATGAVSITVP